MQKKVFKQKATSITSNQSMISSTTSRRVTISTLEQLKIYRLHTGVSTYRKGTGKNIWEYTKRKQKCNVGLSKHET